MDGCLSLSEMLKTPVRATRYGILEGNSSAPLPPDFFPVRESIFGVSLYIQGDLHGISGFCFSIPHTKPLLDGILATNGLLGSPSGDLMRKSILEESTNIFVNTMLKDFSNLLHMDSYTSVPILESLEWQKAWEKILRSQDFEKKGLILYANLSWGSAQKLGHFLFSLSHDASENLKFWSLEGKSQMIPVGIGNLEVANSPTILKASDLGSCVAVVLYDASQKKGAMAHVMLAKNPINESVPLRPGKYADTAIPALLNQLRPKGKVSAYLIGGATMPMASSIISSSIGNMNAEVLRTELKKAGIFIAGEEIGGSLARTVEFLTASGELRITQGQTQRIKKII